MPSHLNVTKYKKIQNLRLETKLKSPKSLELKKLYVNLRKLIKGNIKISVELRKLIDIIGGTDVHLRR
ncbi:hypothetical protein AVDCRST_MAG84-2245 [uncultured Microcoleus sp.]|uniref:Uncharacterized protein n=1 Tax=uncultured Microcoleus sp. TaxID=259945 RepID=A0A6J4LQ13_9CYAN|nr:hypothetical protein AVDCRST_MAG84-2245 [uncultured Microcoleus sp.]